MGDMTDAEAAAAAVAEACGQRPLDVLHFNIGTSVEGRRCGHLARGLGARLRHQPRRGLPPGARGPAGMEAAGKAPSSSSPRLAGLRAGPYSYVSYEASKAALQRMAQSIAREYAPKGIRANVVLPGPIDTPHVTAVVAPDADPQALAEARAALVPMGRQGTAWDVARAALFLASDDAAFITGVLLPVDGGMSL
jgi:NAD(P)-dependent dehydrogenase (short-subunit alcohol dehydrogenase family)